MALHVGKLLCVKRPAVPAHIGRYPATPGWLAIAHLHQRGRDDKCEDRQDCQDHHEIFLVLAKQ
ncbi:MAG: hypothetical protein CL681_00375 [Blastopirellula sp.]|nr:hypothetical protein [Blastopirellula sp.]